MAVLVICLTLLLAPLTALGEESPEKKLLWGDTHLHTSYSFDAFLNGNVDADPTVAYRYAKGLPVIHPYNRTRVQINTPLDFLVVTDHAEFYGGIRDIYNDGIQDPDAGLIRQLIYWYNEREIRNAIDTQTGPTYFADQLPLDRDPRQAAREWVDAIGQAVIPGAQVYAENAWTRARNMAEAHNQPGKFTTLLGWEWSTVPGGANLHRVIVTDADGETAGQFIPFGSNNSPYPEDLWQWLEDTAKLTGANFIAIPHNSNISKGLMFSDVSLRGENIDKTYAQQRSKWEPVTEITQIKGDSETHPDLSPEDEFADFEHYPYYLQREETKAFTASKADFVRSALREGLRLDEALGVNPFAFGVIGSTDSHTSLSSAEEPNFWGKMAFDSVPERKQGNALALGATGWTMQAGGLAAVWAEDNTREAIMAAFKRKEVYGTTGPRIRLQFFTRFRDEVLPMGSTLSGRLESAPVFSVMAQKDPKSANLDRLQIVKGWLQTDGKTAEKIFNVAWSGERVLDGRGKLPAVGDTVDRTNGTWRDDIGATELSADWQDPDFKPGQSAFYYVRVLQIPTPRHALLDAVALGLEEPTEGPSVIQERAYSSAIWLRP